MKEIRHSRSLRETCITHIICSQNKASDSLATFVRLEERTMSWIGSGPPKVLELVSNGCKNIVIE